MPSETLYAHWNPAFRPNSEKNTLASSSSTISCLIGSQPVNELSKSNALIPMLEPGRGISPGNIIDEKNAGVKFEHPEGVEAQILPDSPLQETNGGSEFELRGNYGTKKRSPSRHDSTLSFARTIPEEVTWTDDEFDPEWSSQRVDTETIDFNSNPERVNQPFQLKVRGGVKDKLNLGQVKSPINDIEPRTGDVLETDKECANTTSKSQASSAFPHEELSVSNLVVCKFSQDLKEAYKCLSEQEQSKNDVSHPGGLYQAPSQNIQADHLPPEINQINDGSELHIQANKKDDDHQGQRLSPESKVPSTMLEIESPFDLNLTAPQMVKDSGKETEQTRSELEFDNSLTSNPQRQAPVYADSDISASLIESEVIKRESDIDDLAARWKEALCDDMADDGFLDEDGFLPDDNFDDNITPKNEIDPAALFGSDDEDFLQDVKDDFAVQNNSHISASEIKLNQQTSFLDKLDQPNSVAQGPGFGNSYVPAATEEAVANASVYKFQSLDNCPPKEPQKPDVPQAKSFASMSKRGYSSPFDLPVDFVPRKHVSGSSINNVTPQLNATFARRSSLLDRSSTVSRAPTSGNNSQQTPNGNTKLTKNVKTPQSGFFEDLPPPKPKLTSRNSSIYNPNSKVLSHQQASHPRLETEVLNYHLPTLQQTDQPQSSTTQSVAPLHSLNQTAHLQNFPVAHNSLTSHQGAIQYNHVFTPPPTSTSLRSHQPRTSSPLAHLNSSQEVHSSAHPRSSYYDNLKNSSAYLPTSRQLSSTREIDENEPSLSSQTQISPQAMMHSTPFNLLQSDTQLPHSLPSKDKISPLKRSLSINPSQSHSDTAPMTIVPPQRSRTQSPGSAYLTRPYNPIIKDNFRRPASVEPPLSTLNIHEFHSPQFVAPSSLHERPTEIPQITPYISPTDGRELDPLERWKGSPIFAWGVGGTIVTSFPKNIPRYGMDQLTPMILRLPGEIKIQSIKNIDPLSPHLAKFPGPLKGKSKKKDVVTWLTSGIERLELLKDPSKHTFHSLHEEKRAEERVLLWKILRIFIENDGILEGLSSIEKMVRTTLSPELDEAKISSEPLFATGAEISGLNQSNKIPIQSEIIDPATIDDLKKFLLQGQREKAVWEAVDKRLWAHAILISHTVSQDLYKQVAQEFIQKEVKVIGTNTQSLAALYEIFAGNFEESIDELVPPSARAGFQMVSTSSEAGPSKDGLSGLDRWRETLSLVLSNRSTEDTRALTALGKLLAGYGRAEAAHICFLFARNFAVFSGIDDPLSTIVLVGSDHIRQPHNFNRELEPVLLSEVFEYGISLSNPTAIVSLSPHLSVYKLQYAKILAEYGFCDKALQYCETIATSITSQTRRSLYHHNLLISELDDLRKRLKQSPKDDSSSWISKPSIDKAKGSVWATFNKFVAGDETDSAEVTSDTTNVINTGPFSRMSGEMPILSHSSSSTEIPSFYQGSLGLISSNSTPITTASSRYAPSASHTKGIQENLTSGPHGSQTFQGRTSNDLKHYEPHYQVTQATENNNFALSSSNPTSPGAVQSNLKFAPTSDFVRNPITSMTYETGSINPKNMASGQCSSSLSSEQINITDDQVTQNPQSFQQENITVGPLNNKEPPRSYEPLGFNTPELASSFNPISEQSASEPLSSYLEPQTYSQPVANVEPESPDEILASESLLNDDKMDHLSRDAQVGAKEKTRAEKDREADEAFRRAAEADAKKAQESAPAKRGWGLASWFIGGAKKDQPPTTKPIRAKLGEASSFVYDPELKRWVNKKDTNGQVEKKISMPPPPKAPGPPRPRNVSSQSPAPNSTSLATVVDQITVSPTPPMARTVSNSSVLPPSRPSTSMSTASSIDDLLGPPTLGRKTGARAKKRGRGYVDVIGDKAS